VAKLTAKTRNALPKSSFALPGQRKFPVQDKNHARNALSRAGAIGGSTEATVRAKVHSKYPTIGKMHNGGTVKADGAYDLKAGEHVLTAPEAAKARNHALMASGMKSMATPAPRVRKGTASMTVEPMPKTTATDKTLASPAKPGMPTASISPLAKAGPGWKAQSAIAHPGDTARPTASDTSKT
jgi:hypothetical protein